MNVNASISITSTESRKQSLTDRISIDNTTIVTNNSGLVSKTNSKSTSKQPSKVVTNQQQDTYTTEVAIDSNINNNNNNSNNDIIPIDPELLVNVKDMYKGNDIEFSLQRLKQAPTLPTLTESSSTATDTTDGGGRPGSKNATKGSRPTSASANNKPIPTADKIAATKKGVKASVADTAVTEVMQSSGRSKSANGGKGRGRNQ